MLIYTRRLVLGPVLAPAWSQAVTSYAVYRGTYRGTDLRTVVYRGTEIRRGTHPYLEVETAAGQIAASTCLIQPSAGQIASAYSITTSSEVLAIRFTMAYLLVIPNRGSIGLFYSIDIVALTN